MWEINIGLQAITFLEAVVLGMGFCFVCDILRSVQGFFKMKTVFLIITDFVFAFLCALVTFCFLLATTAGEIRFYVILGIGIGFLLIRKTVSRFVLKFLNAVFESVSKFKNAIFEFLAKICRKILFIIKTALKKCRIFEKIRKTREKRLENT